MNIHTLGIYKGVELRMTATMHAGISDALSICLCAPLVKLGLTSGGLSSARVPRIRRLMGYQIPEKDISHQELNIPGTAQSQSDFHNPCKPDETSTSIDKIMISKSKLCGSCFSHLGREVGGEMGVV